MTQPDSSQLNHRGWRPTLTGYLLGAASGMAINQFSGATAYRAIAVAVIIAALTSASFRLRGLPPQAPLVRYATRSMLFVSLIAAILTIILPSDMVPYLIFCAVGLVAAAILIPPDIVTRMRLLGGIAVIGIGVAMIGQGAAMITGRAFLIGIAAIGFGGAMIGVGVVMFTERQWPLGIVAVGFGFVLIGVVSTVFLEGGLWAGVIAASLGVTMIGSLAALTTNRKLPGGIAAITFVIAAVIGSATMVSNGALLLLIQVVALGLGIVTVCGLIVLIIVRGWSVEVALIGPGVGLIVITLTSLPAEDTLLIVAGLGFGVAAVGGGIAVFANGRHGLGIRRWLKHLVTDPTYATSDGSDRPQAEK